MSSNYVGRNNTIKIIDKINNLKCKFKDDDTEHIILGGASSMILGGNKHSDELHLMAEKLNVSNLHIINSSGYHLDTSISPIFNKCSHV